MPTLVITGHPSSGKTSFARLLADRAVNHPSGLVTSAVIINEESACPGRTKTECYESSAAEKMTRAALKSEFDRHCTSSGGGVGGGGDNDKERRAGRATCLVVLDSLNYIKGYRYELHCIAKAAAERHGVVWVLNDPEVSKGWNRNRRREAERLIEQRRRQQSSDGYNGASAEIEISKVDAPVEDWYRDDDMMDELMLRYEPPDERNRWDKPLYRVDVGSIACRSKVGGSPYKGDKGENDRGETSSGEPSTADVVLSRTVYDMHSLGEAMGSSAALPEPNKPASKAATTEASGATSPQKIAGSSFRRSAGAGFRRNKARGGAASSGGAGSTPASLTAENLSSLTAAANGDGGGRLPPQSTEPLGPPSDAGRDPPSTSPATTATTTPGGNRGGGRPRTLEEMADEILDSFLTNVAPLKGGMSTATPVTAGADVLHDVDSITQRVITAFLDVQRSAAAVGGGGGGGKLVVPVGSGVDSRTVAIRLNRAAQVAELKRLRRQYVKWLSAHPPEDTSEVGIASSFLSYVESQL